MRTDAETRAFERLVRRSARHALAIARLATREDAGVRRRAYALAERLTAEVTDDDSSEAIRARLARLAGSLNENSAPSPPSPDDARASDDPRSYSRRLARLAEAIVDEGLDRASPHALRLALRADSAHGTNAASDDAGSPDSG